MNSKISDKDKKDWQKFLSNKDKLLNKDENYSEKKNFKTRTVDFHGYSLDQANNKIDDLIKQSYKDGVSKLTIITGKGIHSNNEKNPYISKKLSILKNSLPEYINNQEDLLKVIKEIKDARPNEGGGGAFHIFLKIK